MALNLFQQNRKGNGRLGAGSALFFAFFLLTLLLKVADVRQIGPNGTEVGLSTLNNAVFLVLGTSSTCEFISDMLGYVSFLLPLLFALLSLKQGIGCKRLSGIDRNLFLLFGVYILTACFYVLFELIVINYRPILEDGAIAASYPSSHTLLATVLFGTAMVQARMRIFRVRLRVLAQIFAELLLISTVVFRLLSGLHWFTDILGALLLGSALILLYDGFCRKIEKKGSSANS